MANYADSIRSSVVTLPDVATLIDSALNVRGTVAYDTTTRSQSGAGAWVLIANTGVAVTVPAYAYVRQTCTINFSHATSLSEVYVTGAQGSVATLGNSTTVGTVFQASTNGRDISISFTNIWKPGAGSYTYYAAWLSGNATLRYTSYTTNTCEVVRENIV